MAFSRESEEAQEAVKAFEAANEDSGEAAHRLIDAWRLHFGAGGPEPTAEAVAAVAVLQAQAQLALERAKCATQEASSAASASANAAPEAAPLDIAPLVPRRRSRRRSSETKLLRKLGARGQRLLRAFLLVMMVCAAMVAAAAAISLALEIAGFLRLIDEPVQLPLGIQLAVLAAGCIVVIGLRRMLRAVERSLYGSKGRPAQAFPL